MSISTTLEALGDPSRRQIIAFLAGGESAVADIASQFSFSGPAVSQHLKVLRDAGLVTVRPDRQRRYYALNRAPLAEAAAWLARMAGADI
jgi:DNA-binding transcriptional ArsR family regulator